MKKTIASILLLTLMLCTVAFPTAAEESYEASLEESTDTTWQDKIYEETLSLLNEMSDEDYLEVHIELVELTEEEEEACVAEVEEQTGWNIYKIREGGEDRQRFVEYVLAKHEEEQGLEPGSIDKDSDEAIRAVSKEKRSIENLFLRTKQAKRDANKDVFMSEHINPMRMFDHYVSSILIFAGTKAELMAMAKDDRCCSIYYTGNQLVFPEETDSEDTGSQEEPMVLLTGDANADGTVNSLDGAQVLKHDAELIALDREGLAVADVNGDGTVNSLDAAQILKYDAKLITEF